VEVYADRDSSVWPNDGRELLIDSKPLRFAGLPAVAENSWQGAPAGTRVGHMHFCIANLKIGADFYHAALGLNIMTWRYPGALFLSAGGYHHHVGINTWAAGAPSASSQDPRLLFWELVLPSEDQVRRASVNLIESGFVSSSTSGAAFVDPWGSWLRLTHG
jgi:catechol 2,3-dioxygenase